MNIESFGDEIKYLSRLNFLARPRANRTRTAYGRRSVDTCIRVDCLSARPGLYFNQFTVCGRDRMPFR